MELWGSRGRIGGVGGARKWVEVKLLVWLLFGLCGVKCFEGGNSTLTFRVGAIVPTERGSGKCHDAFIGYQLLVDELNKKHDKGQIAMKNMMKPVPFTFVLQKFTSVDEVEENVGKLDFLFGCEEGRSGVATRMARLSYTRRKILMRCCAPEDLSNYGPSDNLVFDIHPHSSKYADLVLRSLYLRSIQRYGVIYDEDDLFHAGACSSALEVIRGFDDVAENRTGIIAKNYSRKAMSDAEQKEFFLNVANNVSEQNVEAMVACMHEDDAEVLVRTFDEIRYPLKAMFLTDGPNNKEWVNRMGDLGTDLLTSTLWTPNQRLADRFFGGNRGFMSKLKSLFDDKVEPNAVIAAAASSGYVLVHALRNAFEVCSLEEGITVDEILNEKPWCVETNNHDPRRGIQRIQATLQTMELDTIIGHVKFDSGQRNDVHPVTVQLSNNSVADVVLPVARRGLIMPARNRYIEHCPRGQRTTGDDFDVCAICPLGTYSDVEDSPHCKLCPFGTYTPLEAAHRCIDCPTGTTTRSEGSQSLKDCNCMSDFYKTKNDTGEECFECPPWATCDGENALPFALPGYFGYPENGSGYECEPPSNCLGGNECKNGWGGMLCSYCKEGHFKLADSCQKCPSKVAFSLLIILLYLGWYMLNIVVSGSMASLDMLLGFAQLANVIGDVGLRWPSKLETTFGITNILDFDLDILWPSCLSNSWSFAHNFYVQLVFPVTMGLMACFGYMLSSISLKLANTSCLSNRNKFWHWVQFVVFIPVNKVQLSHKWDSTIAAFIAAIEVSFVTVTKYLFDVFRCMTINGVQVLQASPEVLCGSRAHNSLVAAAVIGILFYTAGYMSFVAYKLLQMHHHRSYPDPVNVRRYGFLYKQFEPGYIWMATFVLARRLAFVAVLVFMESPAFQAATLALLVTGSLMVHVYTAPYVDTYLDVLFSFLLVALMFQTFGGLMFYSDNLPRSERDIMEIFVLAVISLVGLVFLIIFALELRKKYLVHRLRSIHIEAVLGKGASTSISGSDDDLKDPEVGFPIKNHRSEVSDELLQTFQPEFLFSALDGWEEGLQQWDILTDKLKYYMSDGSETSYLSTDNIARFWRKLVAKFPELIDFLAITDNKTREHFVGFVRALYTDYFLQKRVDKLQIFSVLNWRDRAPLAHWLSSCDEDDRKFFTLFMTQMFQRAHGNHASDALIQKVRASGSMWLNMASLSSDPSTASEVDRVASLDTIPRQLRDFPRNSAQALWFMKSHREQSIRAEIEQGHGPLHHSAHSVTAKKFNKFISKSVASQFLSNTDSTDDQSGGSALEPVEGTEPAGKKECRESGNDENQENRSQNLFYNSRQLNSFKINVKNPFAIAREKFQKKAEEEKAEC